MERLFCVILLALLLDRLAGDPPWLWKHIPHPVSFFGKLILVCDRTGNRAAMRSRQRFLNGCLTVILLLFLSSQAGFLLARLCQGPGFASMLAQAVIVSLFLAQKSLADHVMDVHHTLSKRGVEQGRKAVSMIVGRNPHMLDKSGVCRSAIESLAENTSDGVIAPVFWFVLLGLPGLFAYKMLNTADSMIGHKTIDYTDFGFAAARLDDIANIIPARLTGCLTILTAFFTHSWKTAKKAWQIMLRDAKYHQSPNAGWPESAFAGVLDIRLAGPRYYDTYKVDEPFQNAEGADPDCADIQKAVQLFWSLMTLFTIFIALIGAFLAFIPSL